MAEMSGFSFLRHLRAEANQYVLHYKNGRLTREGAGLAYWFNPFRSALAQVPVEDCETTFLLKERSSDLQEVSVQVTLRYRIADPRIAAARFNFTISLRSGAWMEEPLERLAGVLHQRAQEPARTYLAGVPLEEAIHSGAEVIRGAIESTLKEDGEVAGMGLTLVGVQVIRIVPSAELEKALQTPTRESLQQRADEAVFQRRAMAVEKERAIKENELATEIELARRQEELINRQGENRLLEVRRNAEAEQAKVEAKIEREDLFSRSHARNAQVRAEGDAGAARLLAQATAEGEARRVEVWQKASGRVLLGLALQEFAGKIDHIQHLNLSPSLFGQAFQQLLLEEADQ